MSTAVTAELLAALAALVLGLAIALARTRERLSRVEAVVEQLVKKRGA
jgi:hypothetical protein